jgi:hypothetical protein
MRLVLNTDRNPDEDPLYPGNFSDPFMIEDPADIADVDWSVPGEVAITLVIPCTRG